MATQPQASTTSMTQTGSIDTTHAIETYPSITDGASITPPAALTTKFVPPAACFTDVFTEGTGVDQDHWQTGVGHFLAYRGAQPDCYPSNFSASVTTHSWFLNLVQVSSNFPTFSPGVCPESYELQIQQNIGQSVRQTCCPSGMTLMSLQSSASWCSSTATGPVTKYSSVGKTTDDGTVKTLYSSFVFGTNVLVFAYPMAVAWQSSDLSLFSTATTASNPTLTRASSKPEPSPSVSAGAIAGIAVGAAVILVLLVGIVWVVLWRRHKKRQTAAEQRDDDDDAYAKGQLSGVSKEQAELDGGPIKHEVDGRRDPSEADNWTARAELDAGWRGWEAPAAGRTRSL